MATKKDSDPRPSKADAPKDASPDEMGDTPRKAIADSLPSPEDSGPGEQHHLDPTQRAESRRGGVNPGN